MEKQKAIIVDIDGTIAHRGDRKPYDYSKVDEDTPDLDVLSIINLYRDQGYKLIFVSGREGNPECVNLTFRWMEMNGVDFKKSMVIFRGDGDRRPDNEVKQELYFDHIEPHFNVHLVFDDRPRVIRMWRELGLRVIDVGNGIDF